MRLLAPALIASIIAGNASAEVLLGMAAPLSGSGSWSYSVKRGVELGVRDLNAAGGVLGTAVRVIEVDDFCNGEQAVAAANKLVADGVSFVIGHECSDAAIPASQIYAETGIPMLTPMATNPRLTDQGFANVFRICGRDDAQASIAARLLADRWAAGRIAIVHDGRLYGRGLAEQAKKALNTLGIPEVLFEQLDPELVDFTDVADRIQEVQADVLYYTGRVQPGALLIQELRDRGDDLQFVSGDSLNHELFDVFASGAGEGALFTGFPNVDSLPSPAEVTDLFRAADIDPSDQRALLAYAAVQAWAQAAEQAGSVKAEAVTAALHHGTFDTIYGKIGFDEKGDVTGYEPFAWYTWHDGAIMPAELTN